MKAVFSEIETLADDGKFTLKKSPAIGKDLLDGPASLANAKTATN